MGLFGGEKHTRGTYLEAEEKARGTQETAQSELASGDSAVIYAYLRNRAIRSKARVEKLYGKGQIEAIALNEEYDRLQAKVREALEALGEFEKDKLGMKESVEDIVKENGEKE